MGSSDDELEKNPLCISKETMVILDETKTSRRKSVTDGKDTPGTGKIDGKKSLGTGKTDRKRKVISAPEKNTESSASKKTRIETISSLSSDDELEKNPVKSSSNEKNPVETSPNKKNHKFKPGDKPCIPHLLYNTCKYKRTVR